MKTLPAILIFVLALSGSSSLLAQTAASPTNAASSDSLKLLRQTLADQARFPDKVIRTYTNLPPAQPQLVSPAPVDARETPVVQPAAAPTPTPSAKAAAAAALERQFLQGQLSSRQYQRALQDLERANAVPVAAVPAAAVPKSKPPTVAASPKATIGAAPVLEPAIPTPPPQPTIGQQKVAEVEGKLDEMIRQKDARDALIRVSQTNAIPVPPANLTKRQRLDFLLKQVVEGKLSDEEYKKQRDKILAEPE